MKPSRVQELMRECQAAIVSESALLRQAAETLVINDLSVLIATREDGTIAGLIPETAVIRHLMVNPNRKETVSPILSRHVESVRPEVDINSVLHLFRSSCHAVVPVVDGNNQVVGLLHRSDVVRMLLENTAVDSDHSDTSGQKPHFMNRPDVQKPADKSRPSDESDV